jgi:serine/threonine protein kinase
MTLAAGTKLGPYEVVGLLGAGGRGEVYRAKDTRLGRDVAVKILPKEMSADATRKQRFEREAKTISGLNHPNICMLSLSGQWHHGASNARTLHFLPVISTCETGITDAESVFDAI